MVDAPTPIEELEDVTPMDEDAMIVEDNVMVVDEDTRVLLLDAPPTIVLVVEYPTLELEEVTGKYKLTRTAASIPGDEKVS